MGAVLLKKNRPEICLSGYEKAMQRYTNTALAKEQLSFYEELLAEGVEATIGSEAMA